MLAFLISQPEPYTLFAGALLAALGLPLPGCVAGTCVGLLIIVMMRMAARTWEPRR